MRSIDGIYNSRNDRVWAVARAGTNKKDGIKQRHKFPQSNGLIGCLFQGCNVLDEGAVDCTVYIEKVLPIALKYRNEVFGSDWNFQQDGAIPYSHLI